MSDADDCAVCQAMVIAQEVVERADGTEREPVQPDESFVIGFAAGVEAVRSEILDMVVDRMCDRHSRMIRRAGVMMAARQEMH